MEEGHREVADVVGSELEHLGDGLADTGDPPLAAQARLGRARGAGGEQQVPEAVLGDRRLGGVGWLGVAHFGQPRSVLARRVRLAHEVVDHQDPTGRQGRTEVVAFDEGPVSHVGDEQLALGVGEVAGQFVAPMGRIPADRHRTGERSAPEPEHELGDVVEEQRDVEGAGPTQRAEQSRSPRLLAEDLVVGPGAVGEPEAGPLVAGLLAEQLIDGRHHGPPAAGTDGPVRGPAQRPLTSAPRHKYGTRCNLSDSRVSVTRRQARVET